jgi:hypothetical protein
MVKYIIMNPFLYSSSKSSLIFLLIIVLWVLPWKIYALWTASKNNHKIWFVVLVIVNTFGILEIIYIFGVAKKKWHEVKSTFLRLMSSKK